MFGAAFIAILPKLYSVQCLHQNYAVAANHHHANVVAGAVPVLLHRVVDDDVHEGVETAQNAAHFAATVQLQAHALVHEPGRRRGKGTSPRTGCALVVVE